MWKGWQDQRIAIQATLQAIDISCEAHIACLDEALSLIAKAGILFEKLDLQGQRRLFQHMVERVVINPEGMILRIELRTPFAYLSTLASQGNRDSSTHARTVGKNKNETSTAAGSFFLSIGAPEEFLRPISQHYFQRYDAHFAAALQQF